MKSFKVLFSILLLVLNSHVNGMKRKRNNDQSDNHPTKKLKTCDNTINSCTEILPREIITDKILPHLNSKGLLKMACVNKALNKYMNEKVFSGIPRFTEYDCRLEILAKKGFAIKEALKRVKFTTNDNRSLISNLKFSNQKQMIIIKDYLSYYRTIIHLAKTILTLNNRAHFQTLLEVSKFLLKLDRKGEARFHGLGYFYDRGLEILLELVKKDYEPAKKFLKYIKENAKNLELSSHLARIPEIQSPQNR